MGMNYPEEPKKTRESAGFWFFFRVKLVITR